MAPPGWRPLVAGEVTAFLSTRDGLLWTLLSAASPQEVRTRSITSIDDKQCFPGQSLFLTFFNDSQSRLICSRCLCAEWIKGVEFVADFSEIGGGYGGYNLDHEFFGYRQSI